MTVIMNDGKQNVSNSSFCSSAVSNEERKNIECDKTCQTLPRAPESSGIILLKLKCKLQFRGHVYCQAMCPEALLYTLNWLVANNELYKTKSQ